MEHPPRVPDMEYLCISKETISQLLPNCVAFMPPFTTKLGDDAFEFKLQPGEEDYTAAYTRPGDIMWEKMDLIPRIPQEDPIWIAGAKQSPFMFSASRMYAFLLMSHPEPAKRLSIPKGMVVHYATNRYDPAWMDFYLKTQNKRYPGLPHDPVSHTFMAWGRTHENNPLSTFMYEHQDKFTYTDKGLTYLTPQMLTKGKYINYLAPGKPTFTTLPFLLAASPDGILTRISDGVKFNCEWKAATCFLPIDSSEYTGVEFFYNKNMSPYKIPKNYYIPQVMLQMLVCDTRNCMFGCWTPLKGMNVWEVEYSHEFVSIMLTILNHLFVTFISSTSPLNTRGQIPVGYFTDMDTPVEVVRLYARLETLVLQICNVEPTVFINPDRCKHITYIFTNKDGDSYPRTLHFPNYKHDLPHYGMLEVLLGYFLPDSYMKVDSQYHIKARLYNMDRLTMAATTDETSPLVSFAFCRVVLNAIMREGLRIHDKVGHTKAVMLWRIEKMETYLFSVVLLVYNIHVMLKRWNIKDMSTRLSVMDRYLKEMLKVAHVEVMRMAVQQKIYNEETCVPDYGYTPSTHTVLSKLLHANKSSDKSIGLHNAGYHLLAAKMTNDRFVSTEKFDIPDIDNNISSIDWSFPSGCGKKDEPLALLVAVDRLVPLVCKDSTAFQQAIRSAKKQIDESICQDILSK